MTSSPETDERYDHLFGGHWQQAAPQPEPPRYPEAPGQRYLLPCTVLVPGLVECVLIDVAQARRWLLSGPCVSYVTHPQLKAELDRVIGLFTPPPTRGSLPTLGYHDDVLIFQVESYETLWLQSRGDSRRIRKLVDEGCFTLGLLRRLA